MSHGELTGYQGRAPAGQATTTAAALEKALIRRFGSLGRAPR